METTSRRRSLSSLLFLFACLGACSVNAKFKPVGGTPQWKPELDAPTPDIAEPGTLGITYFCPTLERDDFAERLSSRIREAAAQSRIGKKDRLTDLTKTPHYQIVLSEAGSDGKFSGSIGGGVAGIAGGVVVGAITKNIGAALVTGGVLGVLGYIGLGEKRDLMLFRVECCQYTSSEGLAKLGATGNVKAVEASGLKDDDTGTKVSQEEVNQVLDSTYFEAKAKRLVWVKYFYIVAEGGSFSSEEERTKAAAEKLIQSFPSYVFGGRSIY